MGKDPRRIVRVRVLDRAREAHDPVPAPLRRAPHRLEAARKLEAREARAQLAQAAGLPAARGLDPLLVLEIGVQRQAPILLGEGPLEAALLETNRSVTAA